MNKRAISLIVLVVLFAGLILWFTSQIGLFHDEYNSVVVNLGGAEYQQIKGDIQAVYTTDFGKIVWLALTQANFEKLQESGVAYELCEPPIIKVGGYSFDPRVSEPTLPDELISSYPAGVYNFYIVQFYSTTKDEWIDKLRMESVEYLYYRNGYAHLVQMTPQQASQIEKYDFVRWVGPLHPGYRVPPSMLEEQDADNYIEVWIYDGERGRNMVDQTIKSIEVLGGELIDKSGVSTSPPVKVAIFDLPISAIVDVTHLSGVIQLYYWESPFIEGE